MRKKPLQIYRRLQDGWSERVTNQDPERCDLDGERLWIGPGEQIYCDATHESASADPNVRKTENRLGLNHEAPLPLARETAHLTKQHSDARSRTLESKMG
jgi:hypothetical protein